MVWMRALVSSIGTLTITIRSGPVKRMRLLVIRHAEAVPPGTMRDAERPLTARGVQMFTAAAAGLARLVPVPVVLLTSPLLRARQTAALLAAVWGVEAHEEPALASGRVDRILDALRLHPPDATIALVGHEPTVSALVAELAGMAPPESIAFEPGAAALLEIASLDARDVRLVWRLSPVAAAQAAPGAR
jgi:phosphohistidine phosphatase